MNKQVLRSELGYFMGFFWCDTIPRQSGGFCWANNAPEKAVAGKIFQQDLPGRGEKTDRASFWTTDINRARVYIEDDIGDDAVTQRERLARTEGIGFIVDIVNVTLAEVE